MNIIIGLLWLVAALAAIVLLPVAVLFMLVVMLIGWACGMPLTIKQSGVKIGYVRWFTFHKQDALGEIEEASKLLRKRLHDLKR